MSEDAGRSFRKVEDSDGRDLLNAAQSYVLVTSSMSSTRFLFCLMEGCVIVRISAAVAR